MGGAESAVRGRWCKRGEVRKTIKVIKMREELCVVKVSSGYPGLVRE